MVYTKINDRHQSKGVEGGFSKEPTPRCAIEELNLLTSDCKTH